MGESTVTVVGTELEAAMVCGLLGTEGIAAYSRALGLLVPSLYGAIAGGIEIIVKSEVAQRAKELIDAGR
jgi:hypothetical protein